MTFSIHVMALGTVTFLRGFSYTLRFICLVYVQSVADLSQTEASTARIRNAESWKLHLLLIH